MKKLILLLFFLISQYSNSQIIKGTILDSNGNPVTANILIKKPQTPQLIYQFATTDSRGDYFVKLKEPLDSVIIAVTSYAYETNEKHLKILKNSETIILDFELQTRITALKEVVITENKKITRKKDTIVYDSEKFKDGSEKVVEDLLKKLPGIKISENGEIKFNGKSIKKMLLDGDDLFDNQYIVGSKNMDAALLDKVEVIEKYSENSLLKGIYDSEDVAINLKLKKGKSEFSGNSKLGLGYKNKYDFNTTGIIINAKIKGFGVATYNNVGLNNSPYDFYSNNVSFEDLKENNSTAKSLINQGNFYSPLEDKFHRINKTFYSSFNSLYKLSKKTILKVNLGIYDDQLSRNNKEETTITANNETFTFYQSENNVKSPKLYDGNIHFENKEKEKLHWEYSGKLKYQEINFWSNSINESLKQNNQITSINRYEKHHFNLTKKISDKSAFTTQTNFIKSSAPQQFTLSPGISINESDDSYVQQNNQDSRFDKITFSSTSNYLHTFNSCTWQVQAGFFSIQNKLKSLLRTVSENEEAFSNIDYSNDLKYNLNFPFFNTNWSYNKNKIGLRINLESKYFTINIEDLIRQKTVFENEMIVSPSLQFIYKFSQNTQINSSYSFNQNAPMENNLFVGIIQTGYRSFLNNEFNLGFLKTHAYGINFNYNDLYHQNRLSVQLQHNQRDNNYFIRSLINNEISTTTAFLLNNGNQDYSATINAEKYIHSLRTTFEFNTRYSISYTKNSINAAAIRDIVSRNTLFDFSMRIKLDKNTFVENKSYFMHYATVVQGGNENRFSSLKNALKLVYNLDKRIKTATVLNFISPDLSVENNYLFLDTEITFSSKNKKIEYSLLGRNLTNNKNFETISISDFSRSISSHNLINRFVMVSVGFRF
ncbi:hypothetical protein SAMN05444395_101387 [Flavobacterium fryxellicola]|uniref:Outer membrane protein beta-barrel domain-containing protein n=1 Tax=Flavobacterium fryxellicola TaxID=249352 RepID=A0A167XMK8_9FLAO|nr:TonB-dependent receptor [Flavobacterium fryxellicola]OAB28512.1 hypothetical protein FBFR_07375 [Flavobacterium fryxellicola]SHN52425.1 hypothetical protein SAMN05444395_101387 [Flavobacterium fryxellicola]